MDPLFGVHGFKNAPRWADKYSHSESESDHNLTSINLGIFSYLPYTCNLLNKVVDNFFLLSWLSKYLYKLSKCKLHKWCTAGIEETAIQEAVIYALSKT